jgi:glutathione S-transferase
VIKLYFWPTPNGCKISILLEELGLPYQVEPVHIGKGEQFAPEFVKISPNNKIPAIVDHDGPGGKPYALFESAAIMMYLAEKSGFRFMPSEVEQRYQVVQWLVFPGREHGANARTGTSFQRIRKGKAAVRGRPFHIRSREVVPGDGTTAIRK